MQFVRAIPREYIGDPQVPWPSPMTVTAGFKSRWYGTQVDSTHGMGLLEMFICRACGFVEWYCHDPESIPIGPHYMTELVDYGGDAPYR
jgi:hypothetical protein